MRSAHSGTLHIAVVVQHLYHLILIAFPRGLNHLQVPLAPRVGILIHSPCLWFVHWDVKSVPYFEQIIKTSAAYATQLDWAIEQFVVWHSRMRVVVSRQSDERKG